MMAAVAFDSLPRQTAPRASVWWLRHSSAGSLTYLVVDAVVEYRFASAAVGPALFVGVLLDGIPENVALGGSLSEQGGLALGCGDFVGNFPAGARWGGGDAAGERPSSRCLRSGVLPRW